MPHDSKSDAIHAVLKKREGSFFASSGGTISSADRLPTTLLASHVNLLDSNSLGTLQPKFSWPKSNKRLCISNDPRRIRKAARGASNEKINNVKDNTLPFS